VLLEAIREGLRLLTWSRDSFAYADSFDEDAKRYRGLRCGEVVNISQDNLTGLLVRPEVALRQREAETEIRKPPEEPGDKTPTTAATATASATQAVSRHREPHPARVGRDASRIGDEVIAHLAGLVGSSVKVTLEIEVKVEAGAPENVVRTVTENSHTLKFTTHGFEEE
jgi:hypothetical protein